MNVLVIGSGAREHALVWKLKSSPRVDTIFAAPGNGGASRLATNLQILADDVEALVEAAGRHSIDLTVVGPEVPLASGIVDLFGSRGLAIFGPTRQASRLEWSKAFAKELMREASVPTAEFQVFRDYARAAAFVERHEDPLVVKADGLAVGKGVLICGTRSEAMAALSQCMKERAFGAAGDAVVVEEHLTGPEVSVFAFSDGENISESVAACDYKRALDGDQGPNTGGMGGYSPPRQWTSELLAEVRDQILSPVLRAMAQRGTPYEGVLYAGLMLTEEGPKVLEFNCRLGDPETQVLLPLMESDLLDLMEGCIGGRVHRTELRWSADACVGVVVASQGYPGDYPKGIPIYGIDEVDRDVLVFHGGTKAVESSGRSCYVTDGGRVLTVAGRGQTLAQARQKVYDNIGRIRFEGAHYRTDIGL